MSKFSRKDLKNPDAIQEHLSRLIKKAFSFKKHILVIIYTTLTLFIFGLSYNYIKSRSTKQDALLYYKTIKKIEKNDDNKKEELTKIYKNLKTKPYKSFISYKIAEILFDEKDYDQAKKYYKYTAEKSEGIMKELADFSLAKISLLTGDFINAKKGYKKIEENRFHINRAQAMLDLAKIHIKEKNKPMAITILDKIADSYKNTEYEKLSKIYKMELNN